MRRRTDVNGRPGLVIDGPDRTIGAVTVEFDEQGRVQAIHMVANPDKLGAVDEGREPPLGPS